MTSTLQERPQLRAVSTFSVTGGLAADYIARGEMIPWSGAIVVEGIDTGDKRSIAAGALSHRVLPLPFMVQLENPVGGDGHDGATLSGRIDTLEKMDDGRWWATGFIDPTTVDGDKLALALDKQLIRGVSADLDKVEMLDVKGDNGSATSVITSGRIIGATALPFGAFAEAEIKLDVDRMEALAASAGMDADAPEGRVAQVFLPADAFETIIASAGSSIPVDPPTEWFAKADLKELTPLTVLANGQVFGHIAAWGTCHISFANRCQPVPRSNSNYSKFRTGTVLTAEGTSVRTGPIVMDTVHPDLRWRASDAQAFYADTGSAICDVIPYEDKFGIAVFGALRPDVTPERVRAFRASDISPDWRTIDGLRHECCAMLAVNNSGFKLPQALAASAGMYIEPGDSAIALDAFDEVYALVASGPMTVEPCCAKCDAEHTHEEELSVNDEELSVKKDEETEIARRKAAVVARFGAKPARVFRVAATEFGPLFGGKKAAPFKKGGGRKKSSDKTADGEKKKRKFTKAGKKPWE